MNNELPQHVAVIGAGIVGVHVARALQKRGVQTTLVDQSDPGMATSYGNAGYLATDEIFPLAHGRVLRSLPRMILNPLSPLSVRWQESLRLTPWLARYVRACSTESVQHSINALVTLQRAAAASWRGYASEDKVGHLLREDGAWKLFETDRGLAATENERTVQKTHGIEWEIHTRESLLERLPEIGPTIRHGAFFPNGMSVVNSLAMTQAIFDRFVADGGEFLKTKVLRLDRDPSGSAIMNLQHGTCTADRIVICAGHLSARLLAPLGFQVPLAAERGYHVEMSHGEIGFTAPVGFYERGFYITPMTSGLRLAGTTEFTAATHDPPPNWARADLLKQHVHHVLPDVVEEETGRWMGHRPTLPDFLPALGQAAGFENLFVAFGHHHLGLTLSAITGKTMADVMTNRTPAIDLTPYRLDRF